MAGDHECDPAALRGVRAGEEAGVIAILHVLAIGFENARVGTGLRENLAQHGEIKPERGSEAFGESGGVAIIEVPEGTPRTSQLSFRCFTSNTP